MRRLLITAVLGAVVTCGLAASPAHADAWVHAPDLAGVGAVSDLVVGGEPVWVDAATNQIRTASLQRDRSWVFRTIAEPSGPPILVEGAASVDALQRLSVTYTVGTSLFRAGD